MDLGLSGKVVIVAGGASNIGAAYALGFVREGANVVVADWDEPQAQKVANQARELGGQLIVVKTDVSNWDQVQAMVKKTLDTFNKIDILVNNAGWAGTDRLFTEQTREEWEKSIAITYWGTINCTRAVLDHMVEQRSGAVVNTASDAGKMGEYGEAVHSGNKAAVIALTKSLAREFGPRGIRFNAVCPGLTIGKSETSGELSLWQGEMLAHFADPENQAKAARRYPLRRTGRPEDPTAMVLFLASDVCAGYITGQAISVSGGYTMI